MVRDSPTADTGRQPGERNPAMPQWIYTAQYDTTATRYDSTGASEHPVVANVSEIITAATEAEARDLARAIAGCYAAVGRTLRDERLQSSECPAEPVVAHPVSAPASVAAVERPRLCCRRCGEVGHRGDYPFSTLPDAHLCDDCA